MQSPCPGLLTQRGCPGPAWCLGTVEGGVLWVRKWQEWDQAAKKCPVREKGEPTAPSGTWSLCAGSQGQTSFLAGFFFGNIRIWCFIPLFGEDFGGSALPPWAEGCPATPAHVTFPFPSGTLWFFCAVPDQQPGGENSSKPNPPVVLGALRCPWAVAAEQKPSRSTVAGWCRTSRRNYPKICLCVPGNRSKTHPLLPSAPVSV